MAGRTALRYVLDDDGKLVDAFIQAPMGSDPAPTAVEIEIVRIVKENRELKAEVIKNGYNLIWHVCRNGKIRPYSPLVCSCCLPSDKVWKFNPLDEIKGKDDLLKKSLSMLRHYFNRHGTLYEYTPTETAQHLLNIGDVLKCKMQDAVRKDSQGERGPQPETADTPAAEMLGDMQVLKLSPRDVIVLKYPGVLCEKAWENIKKSMAEMFPDNHCIILEEGMDIRVVAKISEPEEPTPPPVEEYSEADVKP